jgi:hypothetical protein
VTALSQRLATYTTGAGVREEEEAAEEAATDAELGAMGEADHTSVE